MLYPICTIMYNNLMKWEIQILKRKIKIKEQCLHGYMSD